MPRIRNIKPVFFDSPSTAKADLACRLLYQALWCWADDSGHGTCNLKELEAFAFPHDAIRDLPRRKCGSPACICGISGAVWRNFAEILHETAQAYDLVLYIVRRRRYYLIPAFKDHQSKYWRAETAFPEPEEGSIWDLTSEYGPFRSQTCDSSPEFPEHSRGNSAASSGNSPLDRDRDRDRDKDSCATKLRDPAPPKRFVEFWAAYPRRRDRRKAEKAFAAALKRATADTIIAGAQRYAEDPNREDTYTKYAEGWLNGDGWLDEPLPSRNGATLIDWESL
jgi:hypothetical protein